MRPNRTRQFRPRLLVLGIFVCAATLRAQMPGDPQMQGGEDTGGSELSQDMRPGIGFFGGTFSMSHFVNPSGGNPYSLSYTPLWNLSGDTLTAANARVGARWMHGFSIVQFIYMPTYTHSQLYPDSNHWNHAFSIRGLGDHGIVLSPRWRFNFSANGSVDDFQNFLITPSQFGQATSLVTSPNELAGAVLNQQFTNPELASVLTGAPIMESPARLYLFGDRMLMLTGSAGLMYLYSPRLRFSFSLAGIHNQHLSSAPGVSDQAYVDRSTSAFAVTGVSYSVSPRTDLGAVVVVGRSFSPIQRTSSTTGMVNVSRRIRENWFVRADGGIGRISLLGYQVPGSSPLYAVGNFTMGYTHGRHAFLGNATRSLSEQVGFGAGSSLSARAAWSWAPRATGWYLHADAGREAWYQQAGPTLKSWRSSVGGGRRLTRTLSWQADFIYVSYNGSNLGGPANFSIGGFRAALNWTPTGFLIR